MRIQITGMESKEEIPLIESKGYPILFITGNDGKRRELEKFFEPRKMRFLYKKIDLPEIQGERDEIVRQKCYSAVHLLDEKPFIVEDTSLHFNALCGLPGPYVKWFYKSIGSEGLVKLLAGYEDKSATAVTVFGYFDGVGCPEPLLFHGETKGTIVEPRGSNGFGWDDCFLPENSDKTYGELELKDKTKISHRGNALRKLYEHLKAVKEDRESIYKLKEPTFT